ncbi:MAG: hypothetical protein JWO15_3574 [Sphingomonadales bacterium]|nr:hypothetical protein [Sphingomonadales bacterium]
MPQYDFLESESRLIKEAKAAGEHAAKMKTSSSVFLIWRDLAKLFQINDGQRYNHIRVKVRKAFMSNFNKIILMKEIS